MSRIIKENKELEISAGLVIIQDNKILLAHPSSGNWQHSFSFPKGHLKSCESNLEAAIRETNEEIGLDVNVDDIDLESEECINYLDKQGNIYKKFIIF